MATSNYLSEHLPPSVVERLEAGAFRSLCGHLRDRSDQVQNIDLMTVSGFCRNCLAKWLVIEARNLSDSLGKGLIGDKGRSHDSDELHAIMQSLDAMGYDEAAQYVYGMKYDEWKDRHSQKASDETIQKFNDSKPLWATWDKEILAKRAEQPAGARMASMSLSAGKPADVSGGLTTSSLLSNVCCKDIDEQPPTIDEIPVVAEKRNTREVPPYRSPLPPSVSFSLAILTVSDRAASGQYETGDLSGPAVKEAVEEAVSSYGGLVTLQSTDAAIVSDDAEAIQQKLKEWADVSHINLILTTGGTGFSPRDVTPEATNLVVDKVCDGLVAFCTMECARKQPLASLSRGSAGVRGKTLIVNLPGNPQGAQEIIPVLLPLALHALADLAI